MLRFHVISNAKAAETYYRKTDGGAYYANDKLRQEWLGRGAEELGLTGLPDFEHFTRLIHGLDPHTGAQLTAKLVDHRIPAWDVTASIPKGATIALERGDESVRDALWQAVHETVADLERYATTRVRKGDQQGDRVTGNLVGFAVEHAETRPAKGDGMPDPDRHVHVVLFNLTYDPTEREWKAVKFRPIMDQRRFFDRSFDARFARKLADLGYGIETKYKADPKGGRRYFSWDIAGMPASLVAKFSRRTAEVEKLAADLGVSDPRSKDKLGATSRRNKRADLTLGRLTTNWRQQHDAYKAAVNAIAAGKLLAGYDQLAALGWVKQTSTDERHESLVTDYLAALDAGRSVLVVAPTHAEGDELTAQLRAKLKERGDIDGHEQVVEQLRPLNWTEAEKGDRARYDGTEVLQFQRSSGPYRAGERAQAGDERGGRTAPDPRYFSVYRRDALALARGDVVRITANGKDTSGRHKLDNGSQYTIAGFTPKGDIALTNGWVLAKDFGHLAHGYVTTSHASQGRTVDRVLIAMGSASRPAVSAEQFYVSVSRGRERATIYTDLAPAALRDVIQRRDARKSATELLGVPARPPKARVRTFVTRVREVLAQLREKAARAIGEGILAPQREYHVR